METIAETVVEDPNLWPDMTHIKPYLIHIIIHSKHPLQRVILDHQNHDHQPSSKPVLINHQKATTFSIIIKVLKTLQNHLKNINLSVMSKPNLKPYQNLENHQLQI